MGLFAVIFMLRMCLVSWLITVVTATQPPVDAPILPKGLFFRTRQSESTHCFRSGIPQPLANPALTISGFLRRVEIPTILCRKMKTRDWQAHKNTHKNTRKKSSQPTSIPGWKPSARFSLVTAVSLRAYYHLSAQPTIGALRSGVCVRRAGKRRRAHMDSLPCHGRPVSAKCSHRIPDK